MTDLYFAGLDIGTTGVKVMIINQDAEIKSLAYREYPCEYPKPGWVEQNVDIMWNKICETTNEAISKAKISSSLIKSLGISSQRGTFIPVDKNIKPLMNSIVWSDARANIELDWIKENISEERYYQITGVPISSLWSYSKIKWFIDNEKDIFKDTYKILNGQEYFLRKLGAEEISTDPSSLTLNGMLDIRKLNWSEELCSFINLPLEKLPPVGAPARKVGKISEKAAEETGFALNMPIAIGGGDQQCAAIGAGIVKEGMAVVTTGTAMVIVGHLEEVKKDEEKGVLIGGSGIPNKWDIEGVQFTAGAALKWMRDNFGYLEVTSGERLGLDPYDIINLEVNKSPAGSKGLIFFPFFQGQMTPNYEDSAKGGFIGLTLIHSHDDIMRAIMEGVSFETRMVIEAMESVLNKPFSNLRLSGGGAKSDIWSKIQSNIFRRHVERMVISECTTLGATILGAYGCGLFSSVEEGVEKMVKIYDTIEPKVKDSDLYDEEYNIFRNSFNSLSRENIYKDLMAFQKRWF